MFRVVRNAWLNAREKRLFGLFAFEFFVVVLGVLTAQGVQSWVQERDRARDAEAERVRLEQGFFAAVEAGKIWRAAVPCLRERVGEVMRAAGTGAMVMPEFAQRPKFGQYGYSGASPEVFARIASRSGTKKAVALEDMQGRLADIGEAADAIRGKWDLFRLLDPQFGAPTAADRSTARSAGAAILTELRTIEFALDMIEKQAPLLRIKPTTPFDREFGILPVRNCAEIWANGTAYRMIDPGETPPY